MPDASITPARFDACLFDLDGVVTKTARLHAAAWKEMFDGFLRRRATGGGTPFVPFDDERDYAQYVDGKPRYDGVRSFLASRGIALPEGLGADEPGDGTVCALGNRKNALVLELLETRGIEVFDDTVAVLHAVRALGLKTAIVSSSANCQAVLRAASLEDLFDVRVDGTTIAAEGLAGKPAPDTFLRAAGMLGVDPVRAVVFEDAISGVQAGRAGAFGLVVGVDREGAAEALLANGADVALSDLRPLVAGA